jgi:cytochrome c peroxidase
MHNGTMATLEDVVAFYNKGGGDDANMDPRMRPLGLSREERADLVTFLKALTGDPLTGPEHVWTEKIPANYQAIENWRDVQN